ncbi:hypothetical protein D6C91_02109 [Aureobasidium pullulans]|uniref:Uncharacterized protein n=1 Tax=Aureobasidium pullulans TaxID=5580 RepID=A0A4S9TRH9_AURPU|nr:hypothetical protein D6C91_02109 [Aureobasidium pullulans]
MLSSVLAINKHSINNLTLNFIMNSINLIDELKLYKTLDAAITKSHDIQSDVNGPDASKETINTGFAALNIIMDDIRPIDELKLSETLDTATTKIHDIQNDVNEPNVSKETINIAFTALTKIIEEIKTDLANRSINSRVGHAVDFAVSRTDSLPRLYAGLPNPDLPDWPEVRMGLVNQVKAKIEAHYYQLEGSMLMSLDPKVFEDQARKEASTIVFANVEEFPDDMAAELQENTHT